MLENTERAIKRDYPDKLHKTKTNKAKRNTICVEHHITKIRHEPSYEQLDAKTNEHRFMQYYTVHNLTKIIT